MRVKLVSALVAVAVAAAGSGGAQGRRPMTLVALAEIPRLLDPQLSPDGRSVVYTLMRADWRANRQVGHLWRQEVAGGSPVQLTYGESGESGARWSPDGRSILFVAVRDGSPQIHVLPADGGEARQLTRHTTPVSQAAWAPDGSGVYFVAAEARTPEDRERERLRDDVYAFEANFTHRHLWKADLADGSERKLTDGPSSVIAYRPSRDGRRIVLHRAPTPLADDSARSELWVMDADGGRARALTSNAVEETDGELSPDQEQVLFLADANARFEPYYGSTLFLAPAAGGAPSPLLPGFPHAIERAAWSQDATAILAVVNLGVHSEIFRIDVASRRATALTDGRHSVQFWSVAHAASRMIFQLDEETRLGDAWTLPIDGAAAPVRVTGIYDALAADFDLPRQEKVTWKGADGVTIEGILFYPAGYEPGRRYPLVVQLHGGPQESDKFGYGPGVIVNYVPVLTARGYGVLRPNYRGSSGYGQAFLRDVVGGYFRNMHLDVLAGVDALVARGIADPDRLAVMGWSAGGHLTNKLITVTTRFKAASSTSGAANWTSFFAQSDTRVNRELWFGGMPWERGRADAFWSHSPLKEAASVRTPTLLIVGQEDARVPMWQSVEMYRALRAAGVPAKLLIAPREGHQWSELRHQLHKANAELEWFERHVMGRTHQWEQAPGSTAAR